MPSRAEINDRDARLLARYVEILCLALARTERAPAVASLVAGLRRELAGRAVLVRLPRSDARSVVAVVRFEQSGLAVVDVPVAATRCWVVSREHVCDVVARPNDFLADPLRFELPFDLPAPRRRSAIGDFIPAEG